MLSRIPTATSATSRLITRPFSTSLFRFKEGANTLGADAQNNEKRMGSSPQANQPDSINKSVRRDTPNTDPQSTASTEEHKTGDDHPAKQPDHQQEPDRKTGIGGETEVEGGKEGLHHRGDKQ